MAQIGSKKALEVALSRLEGFHTGKVSAEQYTTPSSIAAEVLWKAYMEGYIEGKRVLDLGCGTGILGIGALLLGAERAYMADNSPEALSICKKNLSAHES